MLSPELQTWIKEHSPSTADEAAHLADVFVAARHRAEPWSLSRWKTARDRSSRRPSSASQGSRSTNKASAKRIENLGASVLETIQGVFTPVLFGSIKTNSGLFPPLVRIFWAGVNTANALWCAPNNRTETQLKRWSRFGSKRTLVRSV